jgi:hypothetical protein
MPNSFLPTDHSTDTSESRFVETRAKVIEFEKRQRRVMASPSETDGILREHLALHHEAAELQREHAKLQSPPFNREEHRAHGRKLAAHHWRLVAHAKRLKANKP